MALQSKLIFVRKNWRQTDSITKRLNIVATFIHTNAHEYCKDVLYSYSWYHTGAVSTVRGTTDKLLVFIETRLKIAVHRNDNRD